MRTKAVEKLSVEILIVVLCIIPVAVLVIFNRPGLGAIAAILAAGFLYVRAQQEKASESTAAGREHEDSSHKTAA
jgi:hypothetical protein